MHTTGPNNCNALATTSGLQDRPLRIDRETLALAFAGVHSSFRRRAEMVSGKCGLSAVEILAELGKLHMAGGQEDMIIDVALDLLRNEKGLLEGTD